MHKLTAAIACDSAVCKPTLGSCIGFVDIYIDGIRFAGTREECIKFVNFVDGRCAQVGGLFKETGSDPSKEYVFNGVLYNHETHKVSLGPRVLQKMSRDRYRNITFSQLETAVGRLLYAAAVLGHIIPEYHFPLKISHCSLPGRFMYESRPSVCNRTTNPFVLLLYKMQVLFFFRGGGGSPVSR